MTDRKNWWVTALDGDGNSIEEWLLEGRTELEAVGEAEAALGTMSRFEIEPGVYVEDWTLREAVIEIEGGTVADVRGLPHGWLYEVIEGDAHGGS